MKKEQDIFSEVNLLKLVAAVNPKYPDAEKVVMFILNFIDDRKKANQKTI